MMRIIGWWLQIDVSKRCTSIVDIYIWKQKFVCPCFETTFKAHLFLLYAKLLKLEQFKNKSLVM